MRSPDRAGFTLLELLVALAIGGLVIVGARGLLEGLASYSTRAVSDARRGDARANALHEARELVLRTTLRNDSIPSFEGTDAMARFASSCDVAGGWQEPCEVELVAREGVVMHLSTGDTLLLHAGASPARLVYLASAVEGGTWRDAWGPSILTPLAIGAIAGVDTLLLRVGERR